MKRKDFYYDLPEELIAQEPLNDRQMSRLMVLNKNTGEIRHDVFKNIIEYLNPGDCLVLNDTKVIPARLFGVKEDTGGKIEFVLLHQINKYEWEVILKPGKRAKKGARFVFGNGELKAEIKEIVNDGNRIVKFEYNGIFEEVLDQLGEMPLPHYITKKLENKDRYQTVYAKNKGSAAAPTAGLHFTHGLLEAIRQKGIEVVFITLHVGLGTFRPVKVENITEHKMHSEFYVLSDESAEKINACKQNGGRIIAVGTTSCRTLETAANKKGLVQPGSGWTDIFIFPGYAFKMIDALITNFHLPESTLLMLVSALAGREHILHAYDIAIKEKYRFFSFGDAMFIY
ncbi:MAG: S-adenosylmethionine:tRNA ribosyltransferase-isomerase [Clostridiales bacterium]|jgi:S-adenosylmethionine:tRNA ribosyltransferase-isomerase|nr:S-adenosylmethionine:tRNA ribosyltransferase-isomerase [Clostridiales bacterium]